MFCVFYTPNIGIYGFGIYWLCYVCLPVLQDYHTIVKHVMDLGTIKKKFEKKEYYSAKECVADFRLIFSNCFLYNRPKDVSHI